uniref:Ubiquitin-like protease family profile domain-containing protein n=1 Tax=Solanum tuberosum TaxID=4113 RepID=M1A831_SOLTU
MINYVRGIRPYLGGKDCIGAKRILAVMNMNKTHFVTLEILLHEGRMNVYDCSLMGMKHAKFFTFIQPVFELLPKLLKQSGIMKHLPDKFLNEPWKFEGRLEHMVTDDTKAACMSYSLAFIEHLITRTSIQPPQTLLCDNTVGRMQWIWVAGIVSRSLES